MTTPPIETDSSTDTETLVKETLIEHRDAVAEVIRHTGSGTVERYYARVGSSFIEIEIGDIQATPISHGTFTERLGELSDTDELSIRFRDQLEPETRRQVEDRINEFQGRNTPVSKDADAVRRGPRLHDSGHVEPPVGSEPETLSVEDAF